MAKTNAISFEEIIDNALRSGNWSPLNDWITEECSFSFNYGPPQDNSFFSGKVFECILNFLTQQNFLNSEGSSIVLSILEYEWDTLSDNQKARLLSALEIAFPRFKDWKTRFAIAELLGKYFSDEGAFEVLCRLGSLDEDSRTAAVMGLTYIARKPQTSIVSRKAYNELVQMQNDHSEKVSKEAIASLEKVKKYWKEL